MLKSPKTNTLADGLFERTSSMLDQIAPKTVQKGKEGDCERKKIRMTLNEANPVKNISKNLQSFLEISPMQKEVLGCKTMHMKGR